MIVIIINVIFIYNAALISPSPTLPPRTLHRPPSAPLHRPPPKLAALHTAAPRCAAPPINLPRNWFGLFNRKINGFISICVLKLLNDVALLFFNSQTKGFSNEMLVSHLDISYVDGFFFSIDRLMALFLIAISNY